MEWRKEDEERKAGGDFDWWVRRKENTRKAGGDFDWLLLVRFGFGWSVTVPT
jgi:hypothetical protein